MSIYKHNIIDVIWVI